MALLLAAPCQAASFIYSGTIETADGAFAILLPPGSTVYGTFDFDVPGPDQTTDDPATLLSAEIFAIPAGGSNGFCFTYVTGCEAPGNATVPIAVITEFLVSFDSTGFPVAGFIELFAFAPTDPALWLVFDLSNGQFAFDASPGFGMASGSGDFQQTVVPLPATVWLLACALMLLPGFRASH